MSKAAPVRLGDVAMFVRGITFKPEDVVPVGSPGSVACMRTRNVQATLDLFDVWGIPQSLVKRADQYLQPGDMLVSSANSWNLVGKCCLVPELQWQATFGGFISALRGDSNRVDARYLFHWFSSPRIQATVRSFGQQTTNISNLNVDRCLNLSIPLPLLPEQRRIAQVLDRAEALRAKRRAALAELDTLAQAIFLDMFGDPATNPKGWPTHVLGDLISVGPQNGLYRPASDYGSGIPILRIDAFYDGIVTDLASLKRVRISDEERTLFGLHPGEIVINRVNSREYLGKSAVIPSLDEPTVFESNMMRFDVHREILQPTFLIQYLQTSFIRSRILQSAKDAINQSSINQQDVKAFPVFVPPMAAQELFAQRLASTVRLDAVNRHSLAELDSLFTSLQYRAFRGEL